MSHNKTLAAQLYERVQGVLPAQRRRLFRQLLRLLPARGLHPAARHLHRERRLDQPADRPPAAGGHQRPGQPPRRDHRGQRFLDLRPGLAGGLPLDDRRAVGGPRGGSRPRAGQAGRDPVRAERFRVSAGQVPRPRRLRRGLADLRASGAADRVLGRPDRAAFGHPSHQRRGARAAAGAVHLSLQALRHARGADPRRRGRYPPRAARAARGVEGAGEAAGGAPPQRPHPLRPGDAARGGLLPGHRELQPAPERPPAGIGPRDAVQLLSRRLPAVRRRIARQRAADSRHVCRRPQSQGDAGGARFPAAQRAGQPAAAVRRMGGPHPAGGVRLGHAGSLRAGEDRRRGGRAGDPAHRAVGPGDRGGPGPRPGAAPVGRDPPPGRRGRAGAGHHAHQAPGRRPGRLLQQAETSAASGCTASSTPSSAWRCSATCGRASSTCWWA